MGTSIVVRLGAAGDTAEQRLFVKAPFELKDVCKSIDGRRWDPDSKSWHYPATTAAAESIYSAFCANRMEIDPAAQPLFDGAAKAAAAADSDPHSSLALESIERTSGPPPWRHQRLGFTLVKHQTGTMLACDMGTGKSRILVDSVMNLGLDPALIACPSSVVPVWPREFAKYAAGPYRILALKSGSVAQRAAELRRFMAAPGEGPRVVVVNYEAAWRPPLGPAFDRQGRAMVRVSDGEFERYEWALVACDEIHRIKDAQTNVGEFFWKHMRPRARKRVGLTGTPMPNGPLDAYGQYKFLDPAIFGESFVRFRDQYGVMGGKAPARYVVGYKNMDEFNKRFYRIALRVNKNDVLDLPPATHVVRDVELGAKARKVYAGLEDNLIAEVGSGVVVAGNALTKLLHLAKVTSGFIDVEEMDADGVMQGDSRREIVDTAKRDSVADMLNDLPATEPVVVFCRFRADLDAVHEAAEASKRKSVELSGRRKDIGAIWEHGPDTVAAVQIQAGGIGVDLTRAAYCVYYSVGYSNSDYEQSLARSHRSGQKRPVTYIHLVAPGTVDEDVYGALESKRDIVETVLERLSTRRAAAT